jgi:hypothetical protein
MYRRGHEAAARLNTEAPAKPFSGVTGAFVS